MSIMPFLKGRHKRIMFSQFSFFARKHIF